MNNKQSKLNYRSKINELDARIKWQFKKGFQKVLEIEITNEIPLEWEYFPGTKDKWIRLPIVEEAADVTAFLYAPKRGSTFIPHVHPYHDEGIFFRKGRAIIYTPFYCLEIKAGESIVIKKGIPHIFDFPDDDDGDDPLFEVNYFPRMKDNKWTGTFLQS